MKGAKDGWEGLWEASGCNSYNFIFTDFFSFFFHIYFLIHFTPHDKITTSCKGVCPTALDMQTIILVISLLGVPILLFLLFMPLFCHFHMAPSHDWTHCNLCKGINRSVCSNPNVSLIPQQIYNTNFVIIWVWDEYKIANFVLLGLSFCAWFWAPLTLWCMFSVFWWRRTPGTSPNLPAFLQ